MHEQAAHLFCFSCRCRCNMYISVTNMKYTLMDRQSSMPFSVCSQMHNYVYMYMQLTS